VQGFDGEPGWRCPELEAGKGQTAGTAAEKSHTDIFDAHAFELDICIGGGAAAAPRLTVRPVAAPAAPPGRRGLKIEEWKRRRGIL
jgi:hypothetical protein